MTKRSIDPDVKISTLKDEINELQNEIRGLVELDAKSVKSRRRDSHRLRRNMEQHYKDEDAFINYQTKWATYMNDNLKSRYTEYEELKLKLIEQQNILSEKLKDENVKKKIEKNKTVNLALQLEECQNRYNELSLHVVTEQEIKMSLLSLSSDLKETLSNLTGQFEILHERWLMLGSLAEAGAANMEQNAEFRNTIKQLEEVEIPSLKSSINELKQRRESVIVDISVIQSSNPNKEFSPSPSPSESLEEVVMLDFEPLKEYVKKFKIELDEYEKHTSVSMVDVFQLVDNLDIYMKELLDMGMIPIRDDEKKLLQRADQMKYESKECRKDISKLHDDIQMSKNRKIAVDTEANKTKDEWMDIQKRHENLEQAISQSLIPIKENLPNSISIKCTYIRNRPLGSRKLKASVADITGDSEFIRIGSDKKLRIKDIMDVCWGIDISEYDIKAVADKTQPAWKCFYIQYIASSASSMVGPNMKHFWVVLDSARSEDIKQFIHFFQNYVAATFEEYRDTKQFLLQMAKYKVEHVGKLQKAAIATILDNIMNKN